MGHMRRARELPPAPCTPDAHWASLSGWPSRKAPGSTLMTSAMQSGFHSPSTADGRDKRSKPSPRRNTFDCWWINPVPASRSVAPVSTD